MAAPTLSVYICNYNHGHYLPQCLAGICRQTFTDFEVVITDDGSTDGSQQIIADMAAKDPRFKPRYFEQNQGLMSATIDVCGRATGTYLFGEGSDDFIIDQNFFLHAVTALERDPRPAGFYGITGIYLAEKEKLTASCGTAEVEGYNTPLQCYQGFLKCRSVVTSASCIWRRDLFMKHGGATQDKLFPRFGPQIDFFMSHELAAIYGMYYTKTPFACQRIYAAKTNYSANMHLWETAGRFAELEKGLRALGVTYDGMEADWQRWRAFWMMDTIRKSGMLQSN